MSMVVALVEVEMESATTTTRSSTPRRQNGMDDLPYGWKLEIKQCIQSRVSIQRAKVC